MTRYGKTKKLLAKKGIDIPEMEKRRVKEELIKSRNDCYCPKTKRGIIAISNIVMGQ